MIKNYHTKNPTSFKHHMYYTEYRKKIANVLTRFLYDYTRPQPEGPPTTKPFVLTLPGKTMVQRLSKKNSLQQLIFAFFVDDDYNVMCSNTCRETVFFTNFKPCDLFIINCDNLVYLCDTLWSIKTPEAIRWVKNLVEYTGIGLMENRVILESRDSGDDIPENAPLREVYTYVNKPQRVVRFIGDGKIDDTPSVEYTCSVIYESCKFIGLNVSGLIFDPFLLNQHEHVSDYFFDYYSADKHPFIYLKNPSEYIDLNSFACNNTTERDFVMMNKISAENMARCILDYSKTHSLWIETFFKDPRFKI